MLTARARHCPKSGACFTMVPVSSLEATVARKNQQPRQHCKKQRKMSSQAAHRHPTPPARRPATSSQDCCRRLLKASPSVHITIPKQAHAWLATCSTASQQVRCSHKTRQRHTKRTKSPAVNSAAAAMPLCTRASPTHPACQQLQQTPLALLLLLPAACRDLAICHTAVHTSFPKAFPASTCKQASGCQLPTQQGTASQTGRLTPAAAMLLTVLKPLEYRHTQLKSLLGPAAAAPALNCALLHTCVMSVHHHLYRHRRNIHAHSPTALYTPVHTTALKFVSLSPCVSQSVTSPQMQHPNATANTATQQLCAALCSAPHAPRRLGCV